MLEEHLAATTTDLSKEQRDYESGADLYKSQPVCIRFQLSADPRWGVEESEISTQSEYCQEGKTERWRIPPTTIKGDWTECKELEVYRRGQCCGVTALVWDCDDWCSVDLPIRNLRSF